MRPQIFYIAGVNLHQHFLGDSENDGFSRYCQNHDKFSKFCFNSRNTRFTDMKPWGQKVFKLPKAPFSSLRINFRVVYNTLWSLRYLQIIEKIWNYQ